MAKKWFDIFSAPAGSDCTRVSLYDGIGIGETSSNDFVNALNAIKTAKIDLFIKSDGGEIFEGFACYNAIKAHPAEITAHISGLAASIAAYIPLACDKVVMDKNSFLMIHNGWAQAKGDSEELHKQADLLAKLTETMANAIAEKTGKKIDEVLAAMNADTYLSCEEAKQWGLIDEIEGEGDEAKLASSAMRALAQCQNVPPALRTFAASAAKNLNPPKAKGSPVAKNVKIKYMAGVSNKATIACPHCNEDINVELETPEDEEVEAKAKAQIDKAKEDGVRQEREHRNVFNTAVAAAGMDAATTIEFEKQFYDKSDDVIKFMASHYLAQQTKPLGEAAPGNGEGENDQAVAKADEKVKADCTERFAKDRSFRQMLGCSSSNPQDAVYQDRLARYIAAETKCRNDQARASTRAGTAEDDDRPDDPISKALKNHSLIVK